MKDWVHSQLSVIASGQAQPEEVLLPFMWDGKRTLYQAFKENRLKIDNRANIPEEEKVVSEDE